jgi:ADP-ribosylglycohydrolase
MNNNFIKEKIDEVVNRCKEDDIYSNIMADYFDKGIVKTSYCLESLQILPHLKEKELKKNFEENIKRIIYCINNEIKPGLIIYNVLSCIYGAFYGDVLGSFCEFSEFNKNNHYKIFKNPPVFGGQIGQVTDDSEMSMSMAFAIMDNPSKETIDENYLYFYYGAWSKSGPLDIGTTTKKAFEKFDFKQYHPKKSGFKYIEYDLYSNNFESLSNGFLMRKSTFIVWLFYRFYREINKAFNEIKDTEPLLNLYNKIKDLSRIDNKCTHPNAEADVASSFYCIMALGALFKLRPNNILYKLECLCQNDYFKKEDIDKAFSNFFLSHLNKFKSNNFDFYYFFGNKQSNDCVNNHGMGWYGHGFKLVIYYLLNYEKYEEKTGFETIMKEICDLGGDTDTNCCIVGGIIGPIFGMQNFGPNFQKSLGLIPQNRDMYSIAIMVLYIIYLDKSNKNDELIKNERYFLQTILTLLYDEIDIDLS